MTMVNYAQGYWDDIARVSKQIPDLDALSGKSVLITGAGGVICSAVVDILLYLNADKGAGINIILAGRSRERIAERFHCFKEGRDYGFAAFDALSGQMPEAGADYILHGAGKANPAAFSSEPVETMMAHFLGTQAMLALARLTKAKRVLYISSSEIYGTDAEHTGAYKETDLGRVDIQNPRACYPSAKRAAETLCAAYGAEYGTDYVIVRPGHIYGPSLTEGDDRAFAQFVRKALSEQDIVMKSAGTQLRSYCYSLDCASAILSVLLKGSAGEAYNISNRASVVTIRQVAEALANACGVRVTFEQATDKERKGYNLMNYSGLDASKLEALGWAACFDLTEGITSCLRAMGGGGA